MRAGYRILSRDGLKYVAAAAMVVDHAAVVLLPENSISYWIMRFVIGRMAFPIFCFLFVDGALKTEHPWRHILDLLLFGFISEPLFDMMCYGSWFDFSGQNVMFTWCIGFITVRLLNELSSHSRHMLFKKDMQTWVRYCLSICVGIGACAIVMFLRTDYSYIGVLCMLAGYCTAMVQPSLDTKYRNLIMITAVAVCEFVFTMNFGVLLSIPVVLLYSSEMGRRGWLRKYGFYVFYPLHIGFLLCVRFLAS